MPIIISITLIILILVHDIFFSGIKIKNLKEENILLKDELDNKKAELVKLEKIDPLTDILNSNRLDIELQREFARIKRSHKHMGIIMIGIDNLKIINENISHSIGDYLLKELSTLLKKSIRKTDILGRWWGDKFLIIDSDINDNTIVEFSNKLRLIIEEHKFVRVGHITASFGVTISMENDDEIKIIQRVNMALADAKDKGKNIVIKI